jgi:hypothetical protein
MGPWRAKIVLQSERVRILVQDAEGNDLLKAILPSRIEHRGAVQQLLDALSKWLGGRIMCVVSVAPGFPPSSGYDRWGIDLDPTAGGSVSVEHLFPSDRPGDRIAGIGDFREVRALEPVGWS